MKRAALAVWAFPHPSPRNDVSGRSAILEVSLGDWCPLADALDSALG